MGFLKEFKEFAIKGNVMDMAVGVIIGGAFGKIVSSLVNDILMPPIGAIVGNTDFSDLKIDLSRVRQAVSTVTDTVTDTVAAAADVVTPDNLDAAQAITSVVAEPAAAEPIWWCYGAFIQQCIDFTILAFCVFMMVKLMNSLAKKKEEEVAAEPAPEPEPTKEEVLLTEIRDLLKDKK